MRNLKLIILLLIIYVSISAQPYIPIPTTKAIWTISTLAQGAVPGIYKYGMCGDTVINNVTYKKIYESHDFNFNATSSTTYYRGAIREFAKKVYKINPGTSTEGILYNFNLSVGDTAKSINSFGGFSKKKVTGINFITYNGQVHKTWLFQGGEYWIEGIGSSYALFDALIIPNDLCRSLVCFSIDSTVQYQNSAPACSTPAPYNCDGGFVSIKELSKDDKSLIYPNPVTGVSILKTSIMLEEATLKVYDILGQEVLTNANLNGQEIKVNKGSINHGSYYYTITQNGSLLSKGRFIVE